MPVPLLPTGYTSRPATADDLPALHHLVTICELDLHDRAETDLDSIAADLARPGLDLALDTIVAFDPAGELAARAWVNRRSEVDVHPHHRNRGLGSALLAWTQDRARESGTERLVQTIDDRDHPASQLLRSAGFTTLATSWQLEIATLDPSDLPETPQDIAIRPFTFGDEPAAYQVTEDAFDDWQERRKPYDEWARHTVLRSTFTPAASPVALHHDKLIGAVVSLEQPDTHEGYIERIAVHRDYRNRGIARLLLQHAFAAFHQLGRTTCVLWTHSQTGALGLYQRVGMNVRQSSTVYAKKLCPPEPQDINAQM